MNNERPLGNPQSMLAPLALTYSVEEAALVLGVSKPTIYRLIYREILKPVAYLRHKRIPKAQVHRLAEGGEI